MQTFLIVLHAVVSVLLCLFIALQSKGSGLSSVFGGGGEFHSTKRGAEKFLHNSTVILVAIFVLLALAIALNSK